MENMQVAKSWIAFASTCALAQVWACVRKICASWPDSNLSEKLFRTEGHLQKQNSFEGLKSQSSNVTLEPWNLGALELQLGAL